jgi:hypothetical protein
MVRIPATSQRTEINPVIETIRIRNPLILNPSVPKMDARAMVKRTDMPKKHRDARTSRPPVVQIKPLDLRRQKVSMDNTRATMLNTTVAQRMTLKIPRHIQPQSQKKKIPRPNEADPAMMDKIWAEKRQPSW